MVMTYKELASLLRGELKSEKTILCEEILGITKTDMLIHPQKEIENADEILSAFKRLENNEPMQYILGKWEFMGNTYEVGKGVLIPREDTEAVVRMTFERAKDPKSFVDLGSGSGCIAVSISEHFDIEGYAVEFSPDAFKYLEKNAKNHKVKPILSDMFSKELLEGFCGFDIIISNPPYITEDEMKELSQNVLREPHSALFGGKDGLDYYRKIIKTYTPFLNKNGIMAFEVGHTQADSVISLFKEEGYIDIFEKEDINSKRRAVGARKI